MKSFDWEKVEARRKSWTPNNPKEQSETVLPEVVETLSRCLSLTDLEPAVAEFIEKGLDSIDLFKVSDQAINTLRLNIKDEVNHEIALKRAQRAMIGYNKEVEIMANEIMDQWKALEDNPIVVTAVLESSVFMPMLALYSKFGGTSLQVTSLDISADEVRHANSNKAVCMLLGLKPSKRLLDLRKETVAWYSEKLDILGYTQKRMLTNSEKLLKTGKSDLTDTAEGIVFAPFEMRKDQVSAYA